MWRKAQLERTWREKTYEPFDVVTERALQEVAPGIDARTRARMCETWLSPAGVFRMRGQRWSRWKRRGCAAPSSPTVLRR